MNGGQYVVLTVDRSNELVVRGSKAMTIVFQMSNRVPAFIDQSQLEAKEGTKLNKALHVLSPC